MFELYCSKFNNGKSVNPSAHGNEQALVLFDYYIFKL